MFYIVRVSAATALGRKATPELVAENGVVGG